MISTPNIEQAKKLIKQERQKGIRPLIVQAQDDIFNRKMLENGGFDILLDIERGHKKRGIRQIDSGFNEVLARIAAKNKVSLGIDLEELRSLEKEEQAKRLERIIQNIKICRKSGARIILLNPKDKKNAFAFLISLGASTQQANEAIAF
ncbi:MAG TPA: hypothetical protein VI544_00210 [Candidatus Nanoarchaeia archaeon]|nr:hypothetical protein [Candidatus Nanoarchaeia archaeon]